MQRAGDIASYSRAVVTRYMHRKTVFAMVVLLALGLAGRGESAAAPALPFFDWKACPFEGCSYRAWTARKRIAVYDSLRRDRREIAHLAEGEPVVGLTGVVITYLPGLIRLDRDLPDQKLKRGDTILTYAYRGEGFSAVWFANRYQSDFDISFAKWPDGQGCGGAHCAATYVDLGQKVWWAKVRLPSGLTGWVNMNIARFDGVDMLGQTHGSEPSFIRASVANMPFGYLLKYSR